MKEMTVTTVTIRSVAEMRASRSIVPRSAETKVFIGIHS
jgi:hypothetical protein